MPSQSQNFIYDNMPPTPIGDSLLCSETDFGEVLGLGISAMHAPIHDVAMEGLLTGRGKSEPGRLQVCWERFPHVESFMGASYHTCVGRIGQPEPHWNRTE